MGLCTVESAPQGPRTNLFVERPPARLSLPPRCFFVSVGETRGSRRWNKRLYRSFIVVFSPLLLKLIPEM